MFECLKLQLTINDVIEFGPQPPINFETLEDKEIDRILKDVAKKKEQAKK